MIDLKQFEGIESSPWIFKTEEAGFQCVNFELVTSSEINFGKYGIEIELFSDGSNGCFPVPEKTKEMLLIEKAPELLEEVIALREKLSVRQHIETIHSLQCCANCESYCFKFKEISFCHFMDCDVDPTTVCGDWSNGKSTK